MLVHQCLDDRICHNYEFIRLFRGKVLSALRFAFVDEGIELVDRRRIVAGYVVGQCG